MKTVLQAMVGFVAITGSILCATVCAAQSYQQREIREEVYKLDRILARFREAERPQRESWAYLSGEDRYEYSLTLVSALASNRYLNLSEFPDASEGEVMIRFIQSDRFLPRAFAPLFVSRRFESAYIPLRSVNIQYSKEDPTAIRFRLARPVYVESRFRAAEDSREGDSENRYYEREFEVRSKDELAVKDAVRSLVRLQKLSNPGVSETNPITMDTSDFTSIETRSSEEFDRPLASIERIRIDTNKLPDSIQSVRTLFNELKGKPSEEWYGRFGKPEVAQSRGPKNRWHHALVYEARRGGQKWTEFGELVAMFDNNRLTAIRFSPPMQSENRDPMPSVDLWSDPKFFKPNALLPIAVSIDTARAWPTEEVNDDAWSYPLQRDSRGLAFWSQPVEDGYCTVVAGSVSSYGAIVHREPFQSTKKSMPIFRLEPRLVSVNSFNPASNSKQKQDIENPLFSARLMKIAYVQFSSEPLALEFRSTKIAFENWPSMRLVTD